MDMLASLGITKDLVADLIINIGSIVVLFIIVKKLAYKPVKKFMDARTERVMAQKAEAEALKTLAEEKEEKYNSLLAECEAAKAEAIKEGEKQAHKESEEIISEAKKKAEEIVSKANIKAQDKYNRAVEEANDYIVNLTIDASSMLLKREISDDDNKKIVEEFLKSVDGDKNA